MMLFTEWWVWVAAGLVLAIAEVLVPGFIFAGFAIGAALTGVILGLGLPGAEWMSSSLVNALVVFAVLSVIAWIGLRLTMGVRHGQVKTIRHDIND